MRSQGSEVTVSTVQASHRERTVTLWVSLDQWGASVSSGPPTSGIAVVTRGWCVWGGILPPRDISGRHDCRKARIKEERNTGAPSRKSCDLPQEHVCPFSLSLSLFSYSPPTLSLPLIYFSLFCSLSPLLPLVSLRRQCSHRHPPPLPFSSSCVWRSTNAVFELVTSSFTQVGWLS